LIFIFWRNIDNEFNLPQTKFVGNIYESLLASCLVLVKFGFWWSIYIEFWIEKDNHDQRQGGDGVKTSAQKSLWLKPYLVPEIE
jgi:hypothetical protein